jgi:hypothetical protein
LAPRDPQLRQSRGVFLKGVDERRLPDTRFPGHEDHLSMPL